MMSDNNGENFRIRNDRFWVGFSSDYLDNVKNNLAPKFSTLVKQELGIQIWYDQEILPDIANDPNTTDLHDRVTLVCISLKDSPMQKDIAVSLQSSKDFSKSVFTCLKNFLDKHAPRHELRVNPQGHLLISALD